MTIFFTSDTHFGHANIIKHCNRPFSSVEDMDETMITNWNSRVRSNDTVYHLGDFTMKNGQEALAYESRLNGFIHLIWGNHDRASVRNMDKVWGSSSYAAEICVDGHHITLCHYAMRVWNHSHHGALMLYGHSHGMLPPIKNSLDVGVDCWDFAPVTLPEILNRLGTV